MSLPPLLIRADASAQMGTGHAMRCLALSQAWQEAGGTTRFALASSTPGADARLAAEGMTLSRVGAPPGSADDAAQTAALAREMDAAWVIADGYHFGADYQLAIKQAGLHLLVVDDYGHASRYWADLVLNQNIYADPSLYPCREPSTHLLLGTRYALLRREFWPWRGWQRPLAETAHRVLVTMGGADPDNVTLKVLQALPRIDLPDLQARVVVGGSNPHRQALREALRSGEFEASSPAVELVENTPDMPALMAWADVALSAAGTTCWELAYMQVPSLLVILAENQRPNAAGLEAAGAAFNLGWHGDLSPAGLAAALHRLLAASDVRAAMARRGRALVDGEGGHRVTQRLAEATVRVRPATSADVELLFRWANDPLTRQMSLRSEPIPWEEHRQWFRQVVDDPSTFLLIAERWTAEGWLPVGQVRVDSSGVVSIALAPEHRGQGLSGPALRAALAARRARCPGAALTAYIKPENLASQRLFRKAGFEPMGWAEVIGQWLLKYVLP